MASYDELKFDWSMLCSETTTWTKDDLQLAAELGKTLLERNKELEASVKHYQARGDDQAQEIEYLTKQVTALREVNDSRLRIYEQLEVSIQELERTNHHVMVENASDKKQIKTLTHNVETLENRCDDFTKQIEDINKLLDIERRKNERLRQHETKTTAISNIVKLRPTTKNDDNDDDDDCNVTNNCDEVDFSSLAHSSQNESFSNTFEKEVMKRKANSTHESDKIANELDSHEENEEVIKIVNELETTKKHYLCEQQRVSELEEQLISIIQENQCLQSKIAQANTNEEMKSVHEELSILEEVRQGKMCTRCMRGIDDPDQQEDGSSMGPDDEDRSLMSLLNHSETPRIYRSTVSIKVSDAKSDFTDSATQSPNLYRDLVEKYEALLEVQRHSMRNRQPSALMHEDHPTSGEFSSINTKDTDDGDNKSQGAKRKTCLRTPTDFSEAETSSSGFSDETSNKATQTNDRPGAFLCTIADGEDCKFSIYDDASPIDSRFRNMPKYRELFKEIFAILKKAAENKDEGDKLPLLDDEHPISVVNKVPPVTPATEELPDFGDDNQSIVSSVMSETSIAMSECITKMEKKKVHHKRQDEIVGQENMPPKASGSTALPIVENGKLLIPYKHQPLEYLSVSVHCNKKKSKRNRRSNGDRTDSPIVPSPPRVFYTSSGKKRRDMRPFNMSLGSPALSSNTPNNTNYEWNGNSMMIYNRNLQSNNNSPSNNSNKSQPINTSGLEFCPSTASQDLSRLKKLDLSYAEVLRRADVCKHHRRK